MMYKLEVSVLGDLNELLPIQKRYQLLEVKFQGRQSVKHIIESLGIPHTEMGMISSNQRPVDLNYLVQSGDQIIVHPATPENDNYSGMFHEHKLIVDPKFILDNHLGKLATYLRILDIDAIYRNDYQDDALAIDSVKLNRILLTRDRQLLMRKTIRYGYLVRSLDTDTQIQEIIARFNLSGIIKPFNRCLRCNISLEVVEKQTVMHRLQPKTKKYFQEFYICPQCERIYWKGSHYERMDQAITNIFTLAENAGDESPE